MVCSLHSVTTGSRDRANVPLIIIIIMRTLLLSYVTIILQLASASITPFRTEVIKPHHTAYSIIMMKHGLKWSLPSHCGDKSKARHI